MADNKREVVLEKISTSLRDMGKLREVAGNTDNFEKLLKETKEFIDQNEVIEDDVLSKMIGKINTELSKTLMAGLPK